MVPEGADAPSGFPYCKVVTRGVREGLRPSLKSFPLSLIRRGGLRG